MCFINNISHTWSGEYLEYQNISPPILKIVRGSRNVVRPTKRLKGLGTQLFIQFIYSIA